ncbi:MAG: FkbM family methyltransferase [bacterium]
MTAARLITKLMKNMARVKAFRPLVRLILVLWAKSNKAPGYLYQCMEEAGPLLAAAEPLTGWLPNGFQVRCDLLDHVQRHIYFLGAYEPVESYIFSLMLKPGLTVMDIGANIGQYSLLASKAVGETGQVFAFEPVPKNYNRLTNHISVNHIHNIKSNRMAVWNENGTVNLGLHQPEDLEQNAGSFAIGGQLGNVTAPAIVLDDFIKSNEIRRLDLIKMDIEGAEGFALKGMMQSLARFKPAILMEVNREACSHMNYNPQTFWDLLVRDLGYTAWAIGNDSTQWVKLDSGQEVDRANVLFVYGELPQDLRKDWNLKSCLKWARSGRSI